MNNPRDRYQQDKMILSNFFLNLKEYREIYNKFPISSKDIINHTHINLDSVNHQTISILTMNINLGK